MRLWRFSVILLFCALVTSPVFAKRVITVSTQTDFDNLTKELKAVLKTDDDIVVSFKPGQYEVKERHIDLSGIEASGKCISFKGNGAVLIPKGRSYRDGEPYEDPFSVDNSWMLGTDDLEVWSFVKYADGQVEIINTETKECRIKSNERFHQEIDCSNAYILVTQWFVSGVYKVNKIEGQYIYFIVDDLQADSYKGGYSINNDYNYRKANPRFKLCNVGVNEGCVSVTDGIVHLPKGVESAWEGTTNRFIIISSSAFERIEISGFRFYGNSNRKKATALSFSDVTCKSIIIKDCEFNGFRSDVIGIANTPNVTVEGNRFAGCYRHGVQSNNKSVKTIVRNNEFTHMGKGMTNTSSVSCRGTDFLIADNSFTDYGYCGIGVGEWYKAKKRDLCTGIVENNTLVFTKPFLDNIANYGLMDGGAIYLRTKMDGVEVRNNRIDGFSGMAGNRGIYCDDGAYNFKIIGNVVTGIANSYCIDSRRVENVEERNTPGTGIERANVNIEIRDNVVDGRIRFVGHEDADNGCRIGTNYLLAENDTATVNNIIKQVNTEGSEQTLVFTGMKKGKLGVARKSYKQMRRMSDWRTIRQHFVRKNK